MLVFTPQAVDDLSHILAGLVSFRIGGATEPALTIDHANTIYDEILDHIYSISSQTFHARNTFQGLEKYGEYVYSYKRNRTNWYAFYDKAGDDYVVRRISNNWNILLPKL